MTIKEQLEAHCKLYWWNFGRKTLSFNGNLKKLLKEYNISYVKRKTEHEGLFTYYFKCSSGISFKRMGTISDFKTYAKQFVQMELVRMGDKSELYVNSGYRPTVTVNK